MIPAEAVEAAARGLAAQGWGGWDAVPNELRRAFLRDARLALEAAAPYMLSHERQQTADAHRDAMVNRETKREELAAAWEQGYKSAMFDKEYYSHNTNPYMRDTEGEK